MVKLSIVTSFQVSKLDAIYNVVLHWTCWTKITYRSDVDLFEQITMLLVITEQSLSLTFFTTSPSGKKSAKFGSPSKICLAQTLACTCKSGLKFQLLLFLIEFYYLKNSLLKRYHMFSFRNLTFYMISSPNYNPHQKYVLAHQACTFWWPDRDPNFTSLGHWASA
jgi:hypothetical protein